MEGQVIKQINFIIDIDKCKDLLLKHKDTENSWTILNFQHS